MMSGPFEILLLFLLSATTPGDLPPDLAGLLEPETLLVQLGHGTEEATLAKLIGGADGATDADTADAISKDLENAIQNLASRSDKVRESAREKLAAEGESIRARLETVVANDARRAAEAKKVLEVLDGLAKSAGHRAALARLAAIRQAAAMKLTSLAPAIEKHAESSDPFLRRAARSALTALGKAETVVKAPAARPLGLRREVFALPKETSVLLVSNVTLADVADTGWLTVGSYFDLLAGSIPGDDKSFLEQAKEEASRGLFEFLLRAGNMRPESAALANVGTVGPQGGGLGIFIHGDHEPGVLSTSLSEPDSGFTRREISGTTIFDSPEEFRVVLLSDRCVLLLVPEGSKLFPLEAYLKSYSEERNEIVSNERLATFVKTLEQPFLTRGLAITNEILMGSIYEELNGAPPNLADPVRGMKELELSTRLAQGDKLDLRLEALFEKKEHATDLTAFLEEGLKAQIAQLEQFAGEIPQMKSMLEIMKAVRFSAEGQRGILRIELPKMRIADFFAGIAIKG